jgi:RNA polymerase sigma-70 factor, ECF subfamily
LIFREVEDRDLIKRARKGEVDAFNALVSRWEKRVFNYLFKLLNRREDAQDVAQEVFLKAYQNLRKLEDPGKFTSWLFRIAHNEAYSLLRKSRPEDEFVMDPAGGDTLRRLYPSESALAVASAMARLTGEQVSTVKSRLYTALDVLKDVLAPVEKVAGRRSGDGEMGIESLG